LGITLNDDEVLPFERNTVSCETFKPLRDEVLLAMSQCHPNAIYLNQEGQPRPKETLAVQTARLHEEHHDADVDLRQLVVELPINTDEHYLGAVGPSGDAALMWPHQIYQITESKSHVGIGQTPLQNGTTAGIQASVRP
jgi:hypothetical protein